MTSSERIVRSLQLEMLYHTLYDTFHRQLSDIYNILISKVTLPASHNLY